MFLGMIGTIEYHTGSSCYLMSAWNTAAFLLNMVLTHRTNHTQYLMHSILHIHLVPYTNTVVETNKSLLPVRISMGMDATLGCFWCMCDLVNETSDGVTHSM